jgi:hypothetical protein
MGAHDPSFHVVLDDSFGLPALVGILPSTVSMAEFAGARRSDDFPRTPFVWAQSRQHFAEMAVLRYAVHDNVIPISIEVGRLLRKSNALRYAFQLVQIPHENVGFIRCGSCGDDSRQHQGRCAVPTHPISGSYRKAHFLPTCRRGTNVCPYAPELVDCSGSLTAASSCAAVDT